MVIGARRCPGKRTEDLRVGERFSGAGVWPATSLPPATWDGFWGNRCRAARISTASGCCVDRWGAGALAVAAAAPRRATGGNRVMLRALPTDIHHRRQCPAQHDCGSPLVQRDVATSAVCREEC